jgi:hypothetical protein
LEGGCSTTGRSLQTATPPLRPDPLPRTTPCAPQLPRFVALFCLHCCRLLLLFLSASFADPRSLRSRRYPVESISPPHYCPPPGTHTCTHAGAEKCCFHYCRHRSRLRSCCELTVPLGLCCELQSGHGWSGTLEHWATRSYLYKGIPSPELCLGLLFPSIAFSICLLGRVLASPSGLDFIPHH